MRSVWLAVLAAAAFTPFTLHRLPSADLWWALADGRLIAQTHRIPLTDPFSYTAYGLPWHNDQWLVAWLFYGVYCVGGLAALHLLKTAVLGLTFALAVTQARKRSGAPGWAALLAGLLCMAFSEHAYFFDVRAYLFSYLNFVVLWTLVQRGRPLWLLPPLFLLWVNEHAAVTGGLVMLLLWVLAVRERRLALWALGALAATLLNPGGYHILLHAFRLTGSEWGKYLNEWQPIIGKLEFWPFFVFLAVTLALSWRLEAREKLILCAFGALSLTGWRHVPLFCWLAITPWTFALRRLREFPRLYAPAALLAALAATVLLVRTPLERLSLENTFFPRWACDFLEANHLGERVFHPYGFGGYLLWRGQHVAIDGRAAQVYPVEDYVEYLKAARRADALELYLEDHEATCVVTFKDPRMGEVTSPMLKNWPKVYSDDLCEVFTRRPGPFTYPPSPPGLVDQARQAMAGGADPRHFLTQALQLDPAYAPALFLQGAALLRQGSAEGVLYTEKALEADPDLGGAHLNLAIYYRQKDPARARREAEAELRVNPSSAPARELLQKL